MRPASQETSRLLWIPEVRYRDHKIPPMDPFASKHEIWCSYGGERCRSWSSGSETSVSAYKTTRNHNPEDWDRHSYQTRLERCTLRSTLTFQRRSSRHIALGRCCTNAIRGYCCAIGHSCTNVTRGYCCATMCPSDNPKNVTDRH
jgi:hypothetical protein